MDVHGSYDHASTSIYFRCLKMFSASLPDCCSCRRDLTYWQSQESGGLTFVKGGFRGGGQRKWIIYSFLLLFTFIFRIGVKSWGWMAVLLLLKSELKSISVQVHSCVCSSISCWLTRTSVIASPALVIRKL
jgi:hypothetical protein